MREGLRNPQEDPSVRAYYVERYGVTVGPALRAYELSRHADQVEREELREAVLTEIGRRMEHPGYAAEYSGQQVVRALADLARIDARFEVAASIRAEQVINRGR